MAPCHRIGCRRREVSVPELSIIFRVERETLAVDHFVVLRDRHIDARAPLSIDQLDRLRHGVRIFATVLNRFEAKAGAIQEGILRTVLPRQFLESMHQFH
jgi:hypothetical protein